MATRGLARGLWYVVVALAVAACTGQAADHNYETAVAEIGDVRDSVPATATLFAPGAAEIRAPRMGVIATVHVKEGDKVRAGQVLATLASPARLPMRDEAIAGASAAVANLREAEALLNGAEERLVRSRTLQERGFSSSAAVRSAETEVARAQAAVDRAVSERAVAAARVRVSGAEGSSADVVAPLDGVVTLSTATVGQRVSPEDERSLFQTSQGIGELMLEILVSEADLSRVSKESRVSFTVDAYPGITEEAVLVSIGSAPIREGRFVSYRALAKFNNYAGVMKPGMSAAVQLIAADARNVLRIPDQATHFRPPGHIAPLPPGKLEELKRRHRGDMGLVQASASGLEIRRMLDGGFRVVFVLERGQPVRREVQIGAETDEFIEVTEGLKPGDVVILKTKADPRDAV